MHRQHLLSLALICLLCCSPLDAKPGKGGGGPKFGGGPKKSFSGGPKKSFSPPSRGPKQFSTPSGKGKPDFSSAKPGNGNLKIGEKLTGRDNALQVQRNNELRKLEHRQNTAQKLREISERNGNENLLDTADRMDQKALDHFEKRQAKIDEFAQRGENTPLDNNDLLDPLDKPLTEEQISKLTDPNLQQQHRLLNEERKLEHQLDIAQKLRDLSAKNGNPNLINTAERMEQMAADRYAKQIEKIVPPVLDAPLVNAPVTAPLTE
jgi:hypothetical protein